MVADVRSDATTPLLQALQACTCVSSSLYGPVRLRKQITDALGETVFTSDAHTLVMAIQSENAALEILKQALVDQKMKFGSGGSTLVNLCHVLLNACCDLLRQGVSIQRVRSVLRSVESVSLQTCKRMRLPLKDLPRHPASDQRHDVLQWLGDQLDTPDNEPSCLQGVSVMKAAVQIAKELGSSFERAAILSSSVVFQASTGTPSCVRVFPGLLLPFLREDGGATCLNRLFAGNPTRSLSLQGIALVNGDVALPSDSDDFASVQEALAGIQLLFVYGEIADNVVDLLWHQTRVVCVSVATHNDLKHIVQLCEGSVIVSSIFELRLFAMSQNHMSIRLLSIAPSKLQSRDNEDSYDVFLLLQRQSPSSDSSDPLVSVLLSAPSSIITTEMERETLKALYRLHNTLRCGYALPGNGAVLCGCSAGISLAYIESMKDREASEIASRIADAFLRLGSTLVKNACVETDYWSSYAHVRRVHAQYVTGLQQLGPDNFFAICPYNASKDFALLPIDSYRRMDDYQAVLHAMQQAFRVLEVALSVEQYSIGGLA